MHTIETTPSPLGDEHVNKPWPSRWQRACLLLLAALNVAESWLLLQRKSPLGLLNAAMALLLLLMLIATTPRKPRAPGKRRP